MINRMGLWKALKFIFFTDNNRIGNTISIILLVFHPAVARVIECVALTAGFYIMCKVISIDSGQWKKISLFSFLFVFLPMWEEYMFTQPFAFNYIVAIPLLFWMTYRYCLSSKGKIWLDSIIGILLGGWHESFSLVFLTGCIVLYFFTFKITRRQTIYFISVLIGFIWILINRYFWTRHEELLNIHRNNLKLLICLWPYFIMCLLWLIFILKKSYRNVTYSPIVLFSLGGFIVSPFIVFYLRERAAMPTILMACCSLTIMLSQVFRTKHKTFKTVVALILCTITAWHLGAVCYVTTKIIPNYIEFYKKVAEATKETKYAFVPVFYSHQAPLMALQRPILRGADPNSLLMFSPNFMYENIISAVPEELREYQAGLGESVSDNTDIKLWKGHIVSSNLNDSIHTWATISYQYESKPETVRINNTVFRANDGNQYIYIFPCRSFWAHYFGEPEHITLN